MSTMEVKEMPKRSLCKLDTEKLSKYEDFTKLIGELRKREMSIKLVNLINHQIEEINMFSGSEKELRKHIRSVESKILILIEKELKLVTKNHYRNMWMAIGIAAFGFPIGIILGYSIENMLLLIVGLPVGMAIGMFIGKSLDNKAREKGKQLDVELKL